MPDLGLNFRRFLGGQEKPTDPPRLTELAELEEGQRPPRGETLVPIAEAPSPPTTPASTDRQPPEILAQTKKAPLPRKGSHEPLDPRSWTAWKQSRTPLIAGVMNRKF